MNKEETNSKILRLGPLSQPCLSEKAQSWLGFGLTGYIVFLVKQRKQGWETFFPALGHLDIYDIICRPYKVIN